MRTVQMTLDADLVRDVDKLAAELGTTRSALARDALRAALKKARTIQDEEKWVRTHLEEPGKPLDLVAEMDQLNWPEWKPKRRRQWNGVKSGGSRSKRRTNADRS